MATGWARAPTTPNCGGSSPLPPLRQLAFDLPLAGAHGRDDLAVGRANALAVDLIDAWPDWPGPTVALVGPPGSGKSHIARVWAAASGATTLEAARIDADTPPRGARFVVENADAGVLPERGLFHLLNHVRAEGGHCLLVARTAPTNWNVGLPDLASRLRAAPVVAIDEPDDRLLAAVIVKLFADRQIEAPAAVVDYLVARMERSLEAARQLVALIDAAALARKSRITRPLAAAVLERFDAASPSRQSCFDFDTHAV